MTMAQWPFELLAFGLCLTLSLVSSDKDNGINTSLIHFTHFLCPFSFPHSSHFLLTLPFFPIVVSFPLFAMKKKTSFISYFFLSSQDLASGKSCLSQGILFFCFYLPAAFSEYVSFLSFFSKQYRGWSRVAGIYMMVKQNNCMRFPEVFQ